MLVAGHSRLGGGGDGLSVGVAARLREDEVDQLVGVVCAAGMGQTHAPRAAVHTREATGGTEGQARVTRMARAGWVTCTCAAVARRRVRCAQSSP